MKVQTEYTASVRDYCLSTLVAELLYTCIFINKINVGIHSTP